VNASPIFNVGIARALRGTEIVWPIIISLHRRMLPMLAARGFRQR
jgi:hypothetical protein